MLSSKTNIPITTFLWWHKEAGSSPKQRVGEMSDFVISMSLLCLALEKMGQEEKRDISFFCRILCCMQASGATPLLETDPRAARSLLHFPYASHTRKCYLIDATNSSRLQYTQLTSRSTTHFLRTLVEIIRQLCYASPLVYTLMET